MEITLRLITKDDIETLRIWKNNHKEAFFYQKEITPQTQKKWYRGYLGRNLNNEDFMYIVNYKDNDVGCIGYRIIDNQIDIYNVILGDDRFKGKHLIAQVTKQLCQFLRLSYNFDITAKVLINNYKALKWYLDNGWKDISTIDNYILLRYEGGNKGNEND